MPNYADLTGKDREQATKLMNELVDEATAEAEAKARQEVIKGKLAKLFGGPIDPVNINGGKVTINVKAPSTTSKDAVAEVTEGLPDDVVDALKQQTVSISEDTLKGLLQHPAERVRAYVGVIKERIADWKKKKVAEAEAKGDGSHLTVTVTARKS